MTNRVNCTCGTCRAEGKNKEKLLNIRNKQGEFSAIASILNKN